MRAELQKSLDYGDLALLLASISGIHPSALSRDGFPIAQAGQTLLPAAFRLFVSGIMD